MNRARQLFAAGLSMAGLALCGAALATLPPPSPTQAQAAAASKAQADVQASKEKEELLATMDKLASRWRARAAAQGLRVNPPVAVAASPAGLTAPATGAGPAGQPDGKLSPVTAAAPVRSEKHGTAPPSADVKKQPSEPTRRQGAVQ
jgi:hypothetical protein